MGYCGEKTSREFRLAFLWVVFSLSLGCSQDASSPMSDGALSEDAGPRDSRIEMSLDGDVSTDASAPSPKLDGRVLRDVATPADMRVTSDVATPADMRMTSDVATPADMIAMSDAAGGPAQRTACDRLTERVQGSAGRILRVRPAGPEMVQLDGREMTLRQAVNEAADGDTVLLMDGVYGLPEAADGGYSGIYATVANVTIRGESLDASRVVIDSGYRGHGGSSGAITIDAPGVVLANVTVRRSIFHLVHLLGNADGVTVHNVRLLDGGQQFLKSSGGDNHIDDVVVSCSDFRMTDEGRANVWGYGGRSTHCYTGGIDSHVGRGWHIHDNSFRGIHCTADESPRPAHGRFPEMRGGESYVGGLAEHAIHMWDAPEDGGHTIERNVITDCARGIGIGMRNSVYDTTIRNNVVSSRFPGGGQHDVGISIERGHNIGLFHNTVIFTHVDGYANGIEVRWDETGDVVVRGNLLNRLIRLRNGAEAMQAHNREDASLPWFRAPDEGDLHLRGCPAELVEGIPAAGFVIDDMDEDERPELATLGADQCSQP